MSEDPKGTPIKSAAEMNKNVESARTSGPDDQPGQAPPAQNVDDIERSRNVIRQDTQQAPIEKQIFDEHKTPMTPEERSKRKAMLVQAYDRGIIHDRLKVVLPPHIHGEWVRNDPMEIDRLRTIGFEVDKEFAVRRSIHDDGSGVAIVGDVIHMICPREVKELIDEVRMDKFTAINGKPGDRKAKTKEEKEFVANAARDSGGDVPTFVESSTSTRMSKADVEAALDKVDRQTQVQAVPST
jgi:hypothetical protein